MHALAEPGSLESAVAKAAFDRINVFVTDLQLDHSVAEIAHQVRPDWIEPTAGNSVKLMQSARYCAVVNAGLFFTSPT